MRGRPKKEKPPIPSLKDLLARGDLIDPEQLAHGMRVARVTIYSWVRKGTIPHLKIENSVRFDPEDIREWLQQKRQGGLRGPMRAT